VSGSSFGRGPARRPASKTPRPEGSWSLAVQRARLSFDELTGGPRVELRDDDGDGARVFRAVYSDVAAAAILATALGLWVDTAAALEDDSKTPGHR
jgi:hypothetical protein